MKKILVICLFILTLSCNTDTQSRSSEPYMETIFPEGTNPIKHLFTDEHSTQFYEVEIQGEKYIYLYNRYQATLAITKK